MKSRLKHLVKRLFRPALEDLQRAIGEQALAIESLRAATLVRAPGSVGSTGPAIWRGGLSGRAESPDGTPDPALTRKYLEELRFWVRIARDPEQFPSWTGTFPHVYGGWQQDRNDELASWLDMTPDAYRLWCQANRAVEIGSGPLPLSGTQPLDVGRRDRSPRQRVSSRGSCAAGVRPRGSGPGDG
jgi:hypothetical protein